MQRSLLLEQCVAPETSPHCHTLQGSSEVHAWSWEFLEQAPDDTLLIATSRVHLMHG